jgi:hypothetical protein
MVAWTRWLGFDGILSSHGKRQNSGEEKTRAEKDEISQHHGEEGYHELMRVERMGIPPQEPQVRIN